MLKRLKDINYFRKKIWLRCSTGFQMRLGVCGCVCSVYTYTYLQCKCRPKQIHHTYYNENLHWLTKYSKKVFCNMKKMAKWIVLLSYSKKGGNSMLCTGNHKYNDTYNHGHNTLRIFDVWPNFPFATSQNKRHY